jgi:hypothetical protein
MAVPPDEADLDEDGDTAEQTPLDLDFNPRFVDDPATDTTGVESPEHPEPEIVDMGAYEFQACPGDLNGDRFRNFTDFTLFVDAYGSHQGDPNWNPAADLNADGYVDFTDFNMFAGLYGVPCP